MRPQGVAERLDVTSQRIAKTGIGGRNPGSQLRLDAGELCGYLGMLGAHLIDVQRAPRVPGGEPVPQSDVLGLVMHVQRVEVEMRVPADDRRTFDISGTHLADQQRQFSVEPAQDAVHEDQPRRVAARVLAFGQRSRRRQFGSHVVPPVFPRRRRARQQRGAQTAARYTRGRVGTSPSRLPMLVRLVARSGQ